MAINNAVLVGRLTAAPEVKQTMSQIAVCSFTVAVDRPYKSGEDRQADFINCVAWRGTAEFVGKYFNKGDMIGIIGNIQTRNYEDRDGNKRKAVEVVAREVSFIGSKRQDNGAAQTAPAAPASIDIQVEPIDGDLPF